MGDRLPKGKRIKVGENVISAEHRNRLRSVLRGTILVRGWRGAPWHRGHFGNAVGYEKSQKYHFRALLKTRSTIFLIRKPSVTERGEYALGTGWLKGQEENSHDPGEASLPRKPPPGTKEKVLRRSE